MERAKRSVLKEAWAITRPYWFSEERWVARGLLVSVLVVNLLQVWINVRLNSWRNDFYNSLQNYDRPEFFYQLGLFAVLAGAFIALFVYGVYLQQMLQIRWRRWMTEVYLREWLADKTYYRLQLKGDGTDNPDQRIAEDLNLFPAQTLNLSLGLLTNVVQAVSFSFILWNLSGPLDLPLGSLGTLTIPGYMFWAVLIYTGIATWLAIWLGRPLISLNFQQQRFEADFRFSLVRLRENTESVAFYGGEARELDIFAGRFANVFANFWAIMVRTRILGFAQNGTAQAAVVFPYLVAAPRYFAERLQLGAIQQVADAFIQLQGSLAFVITSYNDIANWKAVLDRLATFRDRVDEIKAAARAPQPIAVERAGNRRCCGPPRGRDSAGWAESRNHDAGSERDQGQTDPGADVRCHGRRGVPRGPRIGVQRAVFAVRAQQRPDHLHGVQGLLALPRQSPHRLRKKRQHHRQLQRRRRLDARP